MSLNLLTCLLSLSIQAQSRDLTLLVWRDLHGSPSPALFAAVKELRDQADAARRPLLALDAGDVFFGSDLAYFSRGASQMDVLSAVLPDAITLGQEDFQWTRSRLDSLLHSAKFPVITTNALDAGQDRPYGGKDKLLFDFDGLRVGLVGIVDPALTWSDSRTSQLQDIRVLDPVPPTREAVANLRRQGAQLIVAISHAGQAADEILLREIPELSIVVGGKDHTAKNTPHRVGTSWSASDASPSGTLMQIHLQLDSAGAIDSLQWTTELPKAKSPTPAKAVEASWDSLFQKASGESLGSLKKPWPKPGDSESEFANFVADAIRAGLHADVAIWPLSEFRSGLRAGPVSRQLLWNALPPPATVSIFHLPGSDLLKLLRRQVNESKEGLALSGVTCTPDSSQRGGSELQAFVGGVALDRNASYSIAIPWALRERIYESLGVSLASANPEDFDTWDRDLVEFWARENGWKASLGRVPANWGKLRHAD